MVTSRSQSVASGLVWPSAGFGMALSLAVCAALSRASAVKAVGPQENR